MTVNRYEIMPGVMLSHIESGKFKTSFMSVSLLTQLTRETASLNALIPNVLLRGSASYPDMEKLSARMEELYGAAFSPLIRRIGEIQTVGLGVSFPEELFLPRGADEFVQVTRLMADILLHPVTRGGLFLPQYVSSEKEKLKQLLESAINDKRGYSFLRCIEEMCCYEDYSAGRYGKPEDLEGISYKKLTRAYQEMLKTAPVEMFYCGHEKPERVVSVIRKAFSTMPRGEINYDIGTDIRLNAIAAEPRLVTEELKVSQARLAIGFRLGQCMDWEDRSPVSVFNALFGGSVSSRLFMNVREKLSLCYDVWSRIDLRKGLMFVISGIDAANYETAKAEIFAQLEAIRRGEFTDEELECAIASVVSDDKAVEDGQCELEAFYTVRALEGTEFSPGEAAERAAGVTREAVIRAAESVECDLIYFLTAPEDEEEEEDEDDTQSQL